MMHGVLGPIEIVGSELRAVNSLMLVVVVLFTPSRDGHKNCLGGGGSKRGKDKEGRSEIMKESMCRRVTDSGTRGLAILLALCLHWLWRGCGVERDSKALVRR